MNYKCNKCGNFVDSSTVPEKCEMCDSLSFSQDNVIIQDIELAQGILIGNFKLIKKIGSGGMGEVWLSEQTAMSRLVALKILNPEYSSKPNFINRFLSEIKHSAKLEHPNIVTAFDAGCDKGIYYLATSFVSGEQLQQKLESEKTIPEKSALKVALGIAKALKYAWDQFNMLHRDIKPGNIIIDSSFNPKLLDMGIAKTINQDNSLTIDGDFVGTPFYISPEQAKTEELDCRSDIYSLGATMYHIVTGVRPFTGDTVISIVAKHLTEPVIPPIEINSQLSSGISNLITRMMAKKKEMRPQSWDEVISLLEALLAPYNASERIEKKETLMHIKKDEASSTFNNDSFKEKPISSSLAKREIVSSIIFSLSLIILFSFLLINNTWNKLVNRLFSDTASFLFSFALELFFKMKKVNLNMSVSWVVLIFIIVVVILFSSFYSANRAEILKKNRFLYFLLGSILPYIYPFIILKEKKSTKSDAKKEEESKEKTSFNGTDEIEKYYHDLFKRLSKEEHSEKGYKLELINENIIVVQKIIEVRHNLAVFEVISKNGNSKEIRIPYSSVKSCVKN